MATATLAPIVIAFDFSPAAYLALDRVVGSHEPAEVRRTSRDVLDRAIGPLAPTPRKPSSDRRLGPAVERS